MYSKDNNDTFGDRLRTLRSEKNLNQAGFGEVLGEIMGTKRVSSSAIGAYERNEREPTYELLRTISGFFNVSIDYLMCTSDERLTVEKYIAKDNYELEELLSKYKVMLNGTELSQSQCKRVLDIAATLILSESDA